MKRTNQTYSDAINIKDQPKIGQAKRFQNMQRRLSIGFSQTRKQRQEDGQLRYAKNRNSKGILVPIFVTLTYPSNEDWNPKDITNYCKKMNEFAKNNWGFNLRYFWVAETTKNGVIHYHYTTWIPRNAKLPKPSEDRIVNNKKIDAPWKYRGKVEGVKKGVYSYLLKYISKGCVISGLGISKPVLDEDGYQVYDKNDKPKMLKPRLFGYGGFDTDQREYMTYSMLPRYVRKYFNSVEYGDKVVRRKGGWELKKQNPVSKIYKYFKYGNELLKTNFELFTISLPENRHYPKRTFIGYTYGINWSFIPESPTHDIWYPF